MSSVPNLPQPDRHPAPRPLDRVPHGTIPHPSRPPLPEGLPRAVEVAFAGIVLLLSAPFLLLCAAAIKLTSAGPVFFRQRRVGQRGTIFQLWKLRTMCADSTGPAVTALTDSRVTPVGRLLRASKLDEVPSLWNVVRGDLSLVGPRPEVPRYVDRRNPLWRKVLRARPGLTDPSTLALRSEEALLARVGGDCERFYRGTLLPFKLRRSAGYLARRNWRTDLGVLFQTAAVVLLPGLMPALAPEDLAPEGRAFEPEPLPIPASRSLRLPRWVVRCVQHALDVAALAAAFALACLLRFDFALTGRETADALNQLPVVVLLQVAVLWFAGAHRFLWRYVGFDEAKAFFAALCGAALTFILLRLALPDSLAAWRVPLSIAIIDFLLALAGVLGPRVLRRVVFERLRQADDAPASAAAARRKVLLLGAGQAGLLAAREILGRRDRDLDICGFVDDDPGKQGAVICGIPVLGTTRDLPALVKRLEVRDVVITIAKISRRQIVRLVDLCRKIGVSARIIPGLYEILQGRVQVSRIRDVEIADLLGRDRVDLDEKAIGRFLAGKRVVITGAGGSIGSELARQTAMFGPSRLLLLERAEFALFEIEKELRRTHPHIPVVPLVADVGDESRLRAIFEAERPQVVLHAAAHKHVPMMEHNAAEAVKNNVFGTRLLGEVSGDCGVEAFVLISTDKAVRPSSVMGATKRVAELVIQDLARRHATRYVAVRFGNVMGSAGSVVPIFREQILRGGPVTVTHPDMKRYFMTIPEAAQLVLQAGTMGQGGEIFILDMGEPVRILDLARAMITLSGASLKECEIVFTGLRPGEKLFEELALAGERTERTRHPKILNGRIAPYPSETVAEALRCLRQLARQGDSEAIRSYLNSLLPEANLRREVDRQPGASTNPAFPLDQLLFPFVKARPTDGSLTAAPL